MPWWVTSVVEVRSAASIACVGSHGYFCVMTAAQAVTNGAAYEVPQRSMLPPPFSEDSMIAPGANASVVELALLKQVTRSG